VIYANTKSTTQLTKLAYTQTDLLI